MKIDARKWMGACLMAACLTATAGVLSATRAVHHVLGNTSTDTVSVRSRVGEMGVRHRMSTSLYPVQMQVMRGMVRIQSEHSQILPIYRQNGSFYMVMRLNKGVNWLNGLPRGRYFINNRPIAIN